MVRKLMEKRASSGFMYCLSVIYTTRQRWECHNAKNKVQGKIKRREEK